MGWLLAGGALLIIFVLKNSGRASATTTPVQAPRAPSAPDRIVVPAPAPPGPVWTVLDATSILAAPEVSPGDDVILNAANIPPELLAVLRAGGAASDQDLERALGRAAELRRADLVAYFQGRLERRRAATRTTRVVSDLDASTVDSVIQTEPDHDPESGMPVERLAMEEVEVPSSQTPRGDRTVRQSVQSAELPSARIARGQLHALALRVADNLRRTQPRAYDQALMKSFQRGAGLAADGDYGDRTRQALGYYGQIPAAQLPASQY